MFFLNSTKGIENYFHSTILEFEEKKKKKQVTLIVKFNELPISKAFKLCSTEYMHQSYPESRSTNCGVQKCWVSLHMLFNDNNRPS